MPDTPKRRRGAKKKAKKETPQQPANPGNKPDPKTVYQPRFTFDDWEREG